MMKHLLILPAVAGAFLLTSCELEEQVEPVEEAYTKAFIKEFGIIDPKQDWNMATRGSVTVNTPSATEVKIYAKKDDAYKLVGDFGGVSGTKTLEFDITRGVTDIIVSANGMSRQTSVGQSVNFTTQASRATSEKTADVTDKDPVGIKVEKTDSYEYFNENDETTHTGVYEYANKLPEKVRNVDKVTDNFQFTTKDKAYSFILYPVYWDTSNVNEIGITYLKNNTRYHVPIYTIKSGDELCGSNEEESSTVYPMFYKDSPEEGTKVGDNDFYNCEALSYIDENGETVTWPVITQSTQKYYNTLTEDEQTKIKNFIAGYLGSLKNRGVYDITKYEIRSYGSCPSVSITATLKGQWYSIQDNTSAKSKINNNTYDAVNFRSRGIQVTVPANTEFAFYIKPSNGNSMYTLTELNEVVTKYGTTTNETEHVVHGATFLNNKGLRCLCFEDWYQENTANEPDLNDVVFYTTLATPENPGSEIEDDEPDSYILAAEDLGNMDDFDFNDMVIEVSLPKLVKSESTEGENGEATTNNTYEVKVTALAAGGTLPLKLLRNGKVLSSTIAGSSVPEQFHSWFGDGNVPTSTMINTRSASSYSTSSITLTLTETEKDAFSMSSIDSKEISKMGGFSFIVDRDGDNNYTGENETEIHAPEDGAAPQMICVPSDWLWPIERTNISVAYPTTDENETTGFGAWGANYGTSNLWYKTPDNEKVVLR